MKQSREVNKLKKQRAQILSLAGNYDELSDKKRTRSWQQLANIDHRLRQLGAITNENS